MKLHQHIKQHHKKYLFGIFGSFAIVKMVVLFAGFLGLANLAGTFAAEPEDSIIATYYGPGSEYTTNRSGNTCDTGAMTVTYVSPGSNTIPSTLNGNTIYVLLSGSYITSDTINLTGCSAIVGSGEVTIYSNIYLMNGVFYVNGRNNTIIDNINIDGLNNGTGGGTHSNNSYGINISSASPSVNNTISNIQSYNSVHGIYLGFSSYTTINNTQTYNNSNYGIYLSTASNNTINNTQIYNNNSYGISLNGSNNTINNTQIYNNNSCGISLLGSNNNTINNSQIYNNSNYGMFLNMSSSNNTTNNVQIYNNSNHGIYLATTSNNAFNNTQIYNNSGYAINLEAMSSNNKFYGTLKLFGNTNGNIAGGTVATGSASDFTGFFSGGVLDTSGTMSCNWVTNPMNSTNNIYLINTTSYPTCNFKGRNASRTGTTAIGYLYGSNILKQKQAIRDIGTTGQIFSWSSLPWDTSKYIAEVNKLMNASFGFVNNITYTTTTGVQVVLTTPDGPMEYVLSGDFTTSPMTGVLTDTAIQDITLTPGYSTKNFTIRYFTGDQERTITASIAYVSPDNLQFTYYGPGSEYTTNRSSNACSLGAMTVTYISPGNQIPSTLSGNTIYVLLSGSHIISSTINLNTCSAIVGSGEVTIYSNTYLMNGTFSVYGTNNTIIDNINIDGLNNGFDGTHNTNTYGIYLFSGSNNTISNIQSYNSNNGIYLGSSSYTTINNTQIYNNSSYGIYLQGSRNTISNSQIYNNNSDGVYLNSHSNSTINNTQIYNNSNNGISLLMSSRNTINNSQIYNNKNYGIYANSSSNNIINDAQIYNNDSNGIYLDMMSSNNKFYGALKLFNNTNGNIGGLGSATGGSASDFTGFFSGGVLDTSGTMACDWITNPMNTADDTYLIDTTSYPTCNFKGGNASRTATNAIGYLYGNSILKQTRAFVDRGGITNSTFFWSNLPWDTSKYIAEVDKLMRASFGFVGDETYTTSATGVQVQLTTLDGTVEYVLSGDFTTSPMTGILTDTVIQDITLTPGYGTKNFSIRYFTGSDEMTIAASIVYLSTDSLQLRYYGPGSEYTTNRSGTTCDPGAITISYINNYETSGADTLPDPLSGNTIYVLLSGSHITSRQINLNTCSAIVGSGEVTLYLSDTIQGSKLRVQGLTNRRGVRAMIYSSKGDIIIDNIHVDGVNNGLGDIHAGNAYGIYLDKTSNSTINATEVHNTTEGMYISSSSYSTITDVQLYNNNRGLYLGSSSHNTIHNLQSYNNVYGIYVISSAASPDNTDFNNVYGIYVISSAASPAGRTAISPSNNTINNTQIYNNIYGIFLSAASDNTINNSQIYNNSFGVYMQSSSGNIINNSQAYNNSNVGIYTDRASVDNAYYGTLKVFANNGGGSQIQSDDENGFTAGSVSDLSGFFSEGVLNTVGTMSCRRITNPVNSATNAYLINTMTYPTCNKKGRNTSRTGSANGYAYGDTILRQTQAIIDTGSVHNSIFSWSSLAWDANKYIAEVNPMTAPLTASIEYDPPQGTATTGNVVATLTLSKSGSITSVGGHTHTFTGNGTFLFTFQDLVGTTGQALATVNRISVENGITIVNPTPNQGIGGGGGGGPAKDQCTQTDCSSSYYDSLCGPCPTTGTAHPSANTKIGDITNSPFSTELNNAYIRAYANNITTMPTIQQANLNGKIIRSHFAKMITEFAIRGLGKKPDTTKACSFADAKNESTEMQFYIKTACQLGLMGREADGNNTKPSFDPKSTITRAQFGTVLSRLLYGTTYNSADKNNWYGKHLQALNKAEIMNDISNPSIEEIRGYVLLMLQRASN